MKGCINGDKLYPRQNWWGEIWGSGAREVRALTSLFSPLFYFKVSMLFDSWLASDQDQGFAFPHQLGVDSHTVPNTTPAASSSPSQVSWECATLQKASPVSWAATDWEPEPFVPHVWLWKTEGHKSHSKWALYWQRSPLMAFLWSYSLAFRPFLQFIT